MNSRKQSRRGFTLIEVMIAMVIMTVGLLAILAVFGQAVSVSQWSQEDQIAKQKAREALESVYAARNDTSLTFASIQNVSNGGIFKDGFQTMYLAGSNGVVGTSSDTATLDRIVYPGADGKMGTADDVIVPLTNYQRQILITSVLNPDASVNPDMRSIVVTVRVVTPGRGSRDYSTRAYISRFP